MSNANISQNKLIEGNINNSVNAITSPIALYYALLELSKITEGETRKQILEALDIKEDEVDEVINRIDDTIVNECSSKANIASSLWVNEDLNIKEDIVNELSSYKNFDVNLVKMGNPNTDKHIQRWINQRTGGMLKSYTSDIKTLSDTCIELLSCVYLKASWVNEFSKNCTSEREFNLEDGSRTKCLFMSSSIDDEYYEEKRFSAVQLPLHGGYYMNLILPNVNETPESISNDEDCIKAISGECGSLRRLYRQINIVLPKFDIKCKESLNDKLRKLGITDVFDMETADFSPCSDLEKKLYLDQVNQATRLRIDEEGVEGASYVEMVLFAGGCEFNKLEEIDFILDRPFIFSICKNGLIMFEGVVNNPNE